MIPISPSERARTILALSVSGFASSAGLRLMDPLYAPIAADFSVSTGQAAQIGTAYALGYGLLQIAMGILGDRIGKYRAIVLLCAASVVASLACAAAASFGQLIAARLFGGLASGAMIPLAMAWIGDAVPVAERQTVLARYIAGATVGAVFGQLIGGVAYDLAGWRAAPLVTAGVFAAATALLLHRARTTPAVLARPGEPLALDLLPPAVRALLATRWARLVLAAVFVEGLAVFAAFAFAGPYIAETFGSAPSLVGLYLATFALGGLVYATITPWLLARLGKRRLVLVSGWTAAAGLVGILVAPKAPLVMVGVVLLGAGFFGLHNMLQHFATQLMPRARSVGTAIFATCFFMSQALGVAAAAPVVDSVGFAPIFIVCALLVATLGTLLHRNYAEIAEAASAGPGLAPRPREDPA